MRLRGLRRSKACFSIKDLYSLYEKFENERIRKFEKLTNKTGIRPDHFIKFIAERTDFCPHNMFTGQTLYWFETVCLFDSEMSLTIPEGFKTPAIFFDALSLVRSQRARVRKEEEKKKD